jgi:hypothetical protein
MSLALSSTSNPVLASRHFLIRTFRFVSQMFPVFPHWVALFGGFSANYFYIARVLQPQTSSEGGFSLADPDETARYLPTFLADFLSNSEPLYTNWLVGGVTMLAMTFLLRAYDEIKDFPTDKINFPDRPLVSGVITHRDLTWIILLTLGFMLILNLPYATQPVFGIFLLCQIFSFLMFKWFFSEKKIRASLPLALLTHHPIVFLFQAYVASFFLNSYSLPPTSIIIFLVGEGLTATAWELGRKIRGTTQEDTYTTYTKIWGRRLPPALVAGIQWISLSMILSTLPQPNLSWIWALPKLSVAFTTIQAVRFIRNPVVAPSFKQYAEAYKLALVLALLYTSFR